MRFAFLIFRYFPYGGLQRDCLAVAQWLRGRGHAVDVFTREWTGPRPAGLTAHIVPAEGTTNHARDRAFAENVQALVRGFDAVVAFNRMPGAGICYVADPCFQARNAGRLGGLYRLTPRYRTYAALEEAVFSPAQGPHVLLLSDVQRRDYADFYGTPPERLHLIPPGIASSHRRPGNAGRLRAAARAEFELGEGDLCLLLVASNFATKGLDRAIRTAAALPPPLRGKVRLIAVGSEHASGFMKLARRLGIKDRVRILPPRDDLQPLYLAADLLIHPSRLDTTGTVILEAIAGGLPVLCTGLCGYAEHVERAEAGIVLPEPFNQDALNDALEKALIPSKLSAWSENAAAYGRAADLYRGREVAARLIETLAGRRAGSAAPPRP